MAGDEAGVVSVAHALLQDPLSEVFAEAVAGADQTVVPAVGLGESAQDSPGDQAAVGQHGQHPPGKKDSSLCPRLLCCRPLSSSRPRLSVLLSVHLLPNSGNKRRTNRRLLRSLAASEVFRERRSSARFSPCRHVCPKS